MNLHGGLTARGQGSGPGQPGANCVTRNSLEAAVAGLEHVRIVPTETPLQHGLRSLWQGLCGALGLDLAREVKVRWPTDQDVVVYTLRGHSVEVSGLDMMQASDYDVGFDTGLKLLRLVGLLERAAYRHEAALKALAASRDA